MIIAPRRIPSNPQSGWPQLSKIAISELSPKQWGITKNGPGHKNAAIKPWFRVYAPFHTSPQVQRKLRSLAKKCHFWATFGTIISCHQRILSRPTMEPWFGRDKSFPINSSQCMRSMSMLLVFCHFFLLLRYFLHSILSRCAIIFGITFWDMLAQSSPKIFNFKQRC